MADVDETGSEAGRPESDDGHKGIEPENEPSPEPERESSPEPEAGPDAPLTREDDAAASHAEAEARAEAEAEADEETDAEATQETEAAAAGTSKRGRSTKPRQRRRRAGTAAVVGAAIAAMDEPAGGPASETGDEPDAGGAADVELPLASAATPVAAVGTSRVSAVDVEPRGGGFGRVLLGLFVILIVLAIGVGLGFGAAALVPSFVDASPPTVTLAPATERPTPPPVPTERPTPSPSPTPSPVPSPTPLVHTVRRGENLTQIANRYDVTVEAVVAANGIKNANLIEVGQKLIIPQPSPEP